MCLSLLQNILLEFTLSNTAAAKTVLSIINVYFFKHYCCFSTILFLHRQRERTKIQFSYKTNSAGLWFFSKGLSSFWTRLLHLQHLSWNWFLVKTDLFLRFSIQSSDIAVCHWTVVIIVVLLHCQWYKYSNYTRWIK